MNEERWRKLLGEERRRVEDSLERYRGQLAATSGERASVDQDAEARIAQLEERLAAVAQGEEWLKEGRYGGSLERGGTIPEARLE